MTSSRPGAGIEQLYYLNTAPSKVPAGRANAVPCTMGNSGLCGSGPPRARCVTLVRSPHATRRSTSAAAVEAALSNKGAEVFVLDDDSSDGTREIVAQKAARSTRLHLIGLTALY